jgi:hypothetical protein
MQNEVSEMNSMNTIKLEEKETGKPEREEPSIETEYGIKIGQRVKRSEKIKLEKSGSRKV